MESKTVFINKLATLVKELIYWQKAAFRSNCHNNQKEYYKKCYEICELTIWNTILLKKIEPQLPVNAEVIRVHARQYALEVLKISEQDLNKKIEYHNESRKKTKNLTYNVDKYNSILDNLMKANSDEEIIQIIKQVKETEKIRTGSITERIPTYVIENYPNQKNTLIRELNRKVTVYKLYEKEESIKNPNPNAKRPGRKKKNSTKEEVAALSTQYVKKFISSDAKNIESFCEMENIEKQDFEKHLSCCKREEYQLYLNFLDQLVIRNNPLKANTVEIIKQMVYLIENGIKIGDKKIRNFDAIDFYLIINLDYQTFGKLLEIKLLESILNIEEIRLIKRFFTNNEEIFQENLIASKKIISGNFLVPVIINGEIKCYYQPLKEELDAILNFFNAHNIPLNKDNYITAVTRYLNNQLPLNYTINKQRRLRVLRN